MLVNMLQLPRWARGGLSAQGLISTAAALCTLPLQKGNVSLARSHLGILKWSQPADVPLQLPGYLSQSKTASLQVIASDLITKISQRCVAPCGSQAGVEANGESVVKSMCYLRLSFTEQLPGSSLSAFSSPRPYDQWHQFSNHAFLQASKRDIFPSSHYSEKLK